MQFFDTYWKSLRHTARRMTRDGILQVLIEETSELILDFSYNDLWINFAMLGFEDNLAIAVPRFVEAFNRNPGGDFRDGVHAVRPLSEYIVNILNPDFSQVYNDIVYYF